MNFCRLICIVFNSSSVDDDYTLHIYDEDNSKEYNLPFSGSKKVIDIKTDMFHCTNIPVSQQIWSGWPSPVEDNMTLAQLSLCKPSHDLSFRSAPVLMDSSFRSEKKTRSRVSIGA